MPNVLNQCITDKYALYNGDSCEVIKGIPDNSIHYTVFSPPFSSLYTYSNSDRDMGNCKNDSEFYEHFIFLAKELYRVTMPGRLLSFHCMKFAEYLIECGEPTEAALKAGYSKGTAKYASQWLKNPKSPKYKPEVAEYIKKLAEKAQDERIITARERQALLSDMAKDTENAPSDRIRAIDTLNKMTGEYTVKVDAQVKPENPFSELSTAELRKLIDDG